MSKIFLIIVIVEQAAFVWRVADGTGTSFGSGLIIPSDAPTSAKPILSPTWTPTTSARPSQSPTLGTTLMPTSAFPIVTTTAVYLEPREVNFALTVANLDADLLQQENILYRKVLQALVDQVILLSVNLSLFAQGIEIKVWKGSTVFDFTIDAADVNAANLITGGLTSGPPGNLGEKLVRALASVAGIDKATTGVLSVQQCSPPHLVVEVQPQVTTTDTKRSNVGVFIALGLMFFVLLVVLLVLLRFRKYIRASYREWYDTRYDSLTIHDGDGENTFYFRRSGHTLTMKHNGGSWVVVSLLFFNATSCKLLTSTGEGGTFPSSNVDLVRVFAEKAHVSFKVCGEAKEVSDLKAKIKKMKDLQKEQKSVNQVRELKEDFSTRKSTESVTDPFKRFIDGKSSLPPKSRLGSGSGSSSDGEDDNIPEVIGNVPYPDETKKVRSELLSIKKIPNIQEQKKLLRDVLRRWHPDKNKENAEVATFIFQYIQTHKDKVVKE